MSDIKTSSSLEKGIYQIGSQAWHILIHAGGVVEEEKNESNKKVYMIYPLEKHQNNSNNKNIVSEDSNDSFLSRSRRKFSKKSLERSSTEIEPDVADVELELWSYGGVKDEDMGDERWHGGWCRPSCIPISIILILIVLVVLLPLLDQKGDKERTVESTQSAAQWAACHNSCRISLVESIPEGLLYPPDATLHSSTYDTWINLINTAESSIEIASFYWSLRGSDIIPYPTADKGEAVFQALLKAGTDKQRDIKIRIAQNSPSQSQPNLDTEYLQKKDAAEVRSLNFAQLVGGGVLHTKFWLVDRKHAYVGSANMDWRSLTEVKEMGIGIFNCSCLTADLGKIFDVYWFLGKKGAQVPVRWPEQYSTKFNKDTPMNLTFNGTNTHTYLSSSPPSFCPRGRTQDLDAVLDVISHAEKFINIAVMDYFPLTIYTPKIKFWPLIDNALRAAAVDHKVRVRLLISHWNHSRNSEEYFLRSLTSISQAFPWVQVQVKYFEVPATEAQSKIPFARVNHNKYMVTDNAAYIGTSNWSGDYFIDTGGVGVIMKDTTTAHSEMNTTSYGLRQQLVDVFDRDWNSEYARYLDKYS